MRSWQRPPPRAIRPEMAVYGSTAGIKDLLSASGSSETWSEPELARMSALLATVSALIERDTGATFGEAQAETLAVESLTCGPLLYLPKGLRSLTGVTDSPEWVSGAWSGGTVLTASEYRLSSRTIDGLYRTLYRVDGAWNGTYLVAGFWEDTSENIPEEIHYLANYLSAEIYKKQKASPAGFVGPDGVAVAVRNTFNEPEVKRILDMHRVNNSVVFF